MRYRVMPNGTGFDTLVPYFTFDTWSNQRRLTYPRGGYATKEAAVKAFIKSKKRAINRCMDGLDKHNNAIKSAQRLST